MKNLFDSNGQHIATDVIGQLHSTTGQNIGHFLESTGFYIDMQGYYLGEVHSGNRLLYRLDNVNQNVCYGNLGNFGSIGNFGIPANDGTFKEMDGFRDIEIGKLK